MARKSASSPRAGRAWEQWPHVLPVAGVEDPGRPAHRRDPTVRQLLYAAAVTGSLVGH